MEKVGLSARRLRCRNVATGHQNIVVEVAAETVPAILHHTVFERDVVSFTKPNEGGAPGVVAAKEFPTVERNARGIGDRENIAALRRIGGATEDRDVILAVQSERRGVGRAL